MRKRPDGNYFKRISWFIRFLFIKIGWIYRWNKSFYAFAAYDTIAPGYENMVCFVAQRNHIWLVGRWDTGEYRCVYVDGYYYADYGGWALAHETAVMEHNMFLSKEFGIPFESLND